MNKAIIFLASILLSFHAYPSIIYTDVVDTTISISGGYYELDLDQNSVIDFKIDLYYPSFPYNNFIRAIPQSSNQVGVESILPLTGKLAWNLNPGDPIDENLSTWMTPGIGFPDEILLAFRAKFTAGGSFLNQEGYLPLEFKIGSNTHFGWVRISVNDECSEFTIKDFAYENISNTTISAGNSGIVGLGEIQNDDFKVYPNPTSGLITIEFSNNVINKIDIYSVNGLLIGSIEKQLHLINLQEYGSGQYIVVLYFKDNSIVTKKIIVK